MAPFSVSPPRPQAWHKKPPGGLAQSPPAPLPALAHHLLGRLGQHPTDSMADSAAKAITSQGACAHPGGAWCPSFTSGRLGPDGDLVCPRGGCQVDADINAAFSRLVLCVSPSGRAGVAALESAACALTAPCGAIPRFDAHAVPVLREQQYCSSVRPLAAPAPPHPVLSGTSNATVQQAMKAIGHKSTS
ncbi:hypothetical protein VOLCADRAFT_87271 [Volvox carteri f. nagariensis]|uniref:Uncharacterized protein n=1 Tax=Volvox carteri f. nagariensis TaxID=3068 RepID=D8TKW6_VOLCA|nr:uncharacterized protein VOLCADRAFT_87271 [Volvox carteri f. nagariensis]EFJ51635.1 hypothetical protein VOLCADRAFT_87271 [Volvox carteri f. nagariensis]|eukprot:XP_002947045.1 hypothetical protein VOLCADRAFT_87271 [Volvox carteri f. nagariensis]